MRNPAFEDLDITKYSGKADEEIKVTVSKKGFEIQEVEVIVMNEIGEVVEEGKGRKGLVNEWIYKTIKELEGSATPRFMVRVKEITGNIKHKIFNESEK